MNSPLRHFTSIRRLFHAPADNGHGSSNDHPKPPIKEFVPTDNHSSRNGARIDMVVVHCTEETLPKTLEEFTVNSVKSAHYVIDRNGDIYQLVADSERANHCKGANETSIGIEHVGGIQDKLAPDQAAASATLIRWLLEQYDIPFKRVFGHDFAPGRKTDTSCPDHLFGPDHDQDTVEAWVTANVLGGLSPSSAGIPAAMVLPKFGKWVVSSSDGEANVRPKPRKAGKILKVLKNGSTVGVYEQRDGWSRIEFGEQQWVSASLLKKATSVNVLPATSGPGPSSATLSGSGVDRILAVAEASDLIVYKWGGGHGRVARGYTKGMALAFGRTYCKLLANDPIALETAKAVDGANNLDALVRNGSRLSEAEIPVPSAAGVEMLMTVYAVLMGLGVNESDGKWHEGMYGPDGNATHETAEAGIFQTSFNITDNHANARKLYAAYRGKTDPWLPIFQEGVPYHPNGLKNHGNGPGVEFQELSKYSPTFAAEMAALRMRTKCTHWAPLRDKYVLLTDEALQFFREVKAEIDKSNSCPLLLPS
jgi:uncharacterized protein YgiM (DUF1202 family)